MVVIDSPRFGRIEVADDEVITFPEGMLGFSECKHYVFWRPAPESPLVLMQSTDVPALAFVVVDPRVVKPDFEVKVTAAQLAAVELTNPADARVWVTLTIPRDPSKMTANLQGPVVVNPARRLAAQLVVNDESATTKYPVLQGLKSQGRVCAGRG